MGWFTYAKFIKLINKEQIPHRKTGLIWNINLPLDSTTARLNKQAKYGIEKFESI